MEKRPSSSRTRRVRQARKRNTRRNKNNGALLPQECLPKTSSTSTTKLPVLNTFIGYDGGIDADFRFQFESYSRMFEIYILREKSGAAGLEFLSKMQDESTEEDVIDSLSVLCQPFFQQHQATTSKSESCSLYDILYPRTLRLYLTTEGKLPKLQPLEYAPFRTAIHCIDKMTVDHTGLTIYHPSELIIRERPNISCVFKGYHGETPLCIKIAGHHPPEALHREIEALRRLVHLKNKGSVRFPHITGLIQSDSSPQLIVGFVMNYIESAQDLGSLDLSKIPAKKRTSWTRVLRLALQSVHSIDLTWGDVKPQNILRDLNGRLWMIDFGGGTTPGWTSEQSNGTIEDDIKALERVCEFVTMTTS